VVSRRSAVASKASISNVSLPNPQQNVGQREREKRLREVEARRNRVRACSLPSPYTPFLEVSQTLRPKKNKEKAELTFFSPNPPSVSAEQIVPDVSFI